VNWLTAESKSSRAQTLDPIHAPYFPPPAPSPTGGVRTPYLVVGTVAAPAPAQIRSVEEEKEEGSREGRVPTVRDLPASPHPLLSPSDPFSHGWSEDPILGGWHRCRSRPCTDPLGGGGEGRGEQGRKGTGRAGPPGIAAQIHRAGCAAIQAGCADHTASLPHRATLELERRGLLDPLDLASEEAAPPPKGSRRRGCTAHGSKVDVPAPPLTNQSCGARDSPLR
jgi:hypothetical protein